MAVVRTAGEGVPAAVARPAGEDHRSVLADRDLEEAVRRVDRVDRVERVKRVNR